MSSTVQPSGIVVGFDMDGVIIDHAANKLALAESYAVRLKPEETHSELLPLKFAHSEYLAFQNELYGNSDFALSAPLMEGANEVLHEFKQRGIPLVLISRRRTPANAITLLERRGLWGDIFTKANAFFVAAPAEKNAIGVREGVTHFFDDERKVLRVIPDIERRFLFDSFMQFEDEKEFERIFSWDMLRRKVLLDE